MNKDIDLRPGQNDYRVVTQVQGPGGKSDRRMGPDVLVTARDEQHAIEIVKQQGHELNQYFPIQKIRK